MAKPQGIDKEREKIIKRFTKELPVLRVKLMVTQEALSSAIGISRQTYTACESKRRMSWNTFLLLYFYFDSQKETNQYMQTLGDFTDRVRELLKTEKTPFLTISASQSKIPAGDQTGKNN